MLTCGTCGYNWERGQNGWHSCVTRLEASIATLTAERDRLKPLLANAVTNGLNGIAALTAERDELDNYSRYLWNWHCKDAPTFVEWQSDMNSTEERSE